MNYFPKLLLIYSILNLVSNGLYAQGKTIFIQIDTVKTFDKKRTEQTSDFSFFQKDSFLGERFDSTANWNFNELPNYTNRINIGPESILFIPLDFNRGRIWLLGFEQCDTIRISNIELFNTQPPDTTYSTTWYYKLKEGKLDTNSVKIRRERMIEKQISPPPKIKLIVNGKIYVSSLTLKKFPGISRMHGHGYKPKRHKNRKGEYKRKAVYINIIRYTEKLFWEGFVTNKN